MTNNHLPEPEMMWSADLSALAHLFPQVFGSWSFRPLFPASELSWLPLGSSRVGINMSQIQQIKWSLLGPGSGYINIK